jgi:hypothetical protein
MTVRSAALGAFALASALCTAIPCPAQSQGLTPFLDPSDKALSARVSTFYRSPNLQEVPDLVSRWAASASAQRNDGIPPMVGFVAGLAVKYPDKIMSMFPASLSPKGRHVAVLGVRVGGLKDRAQQLARSYGWSEEEIAKAGQGGVIQSVRITSANDLDILWGASFASGDARYVRQILDFYAGVVNRKEITTAARIHSSNRPSTSSWPRRPPRPRPRGSCF